MRSIELFTFFPSIFPVSFTRRPLDFHVCVWIQSVILIVVCESEKALTYIGVVFFNNLVLVQEMFNQQNRLTDFNVTE